MADPNETQGKKIPQKGDSSAKDNWIHRAEHGKYQTRENGAAQEQLNRIESEQKSADKAEKLLEHVLQAKEDEKVNAFMTGPRGGKRKRRKTRRKKYTRWDSNPRSRSTGS